MHAGQRRPPGVGLSKTIVKSYKKEVLLELDPNEVRV